MCCFWSLFNSYHVFTPARSANNGHHGSLLPDTKHWRRLACTCMWLSSLKKVWNSLFSTVHSGKNFQNFGEALHTHFCRKIAQNKNWAHPKATTLPRICKVEMQQASLLYYSAKPQSGGILGCALVCPTSLYVRTIRFPTFCRSLPSVGAYSQYPAWSGCRRSADVPRADHDRVGSSPWQGGFKEGVYCAFLPSICLIFSTSKYAATAFNFKHKKTINVTDLSWPKTFRYRF